MRCLIPVEQERYPKNALKRAKICDEVILLYIVEKRILDKMIAESSYILPTHALEELKRNIIDMQRREAEKIKDNIIVPVHLRFVVGEYYESLEKEVLRSSPDLVMVDEFFRGLLRIPVPIMVDRGGKINEATFVISSVRRINKIKRDIEFVQFLCRRLDTTLFLHHTREDEEGKRVLKRLGSLSPEMRGEMIIVEKEYLKYKLDRTLLLV